MKAAVRPLEGPEDVRGVDEGRAIAYPNMPEMREFEFFARAYRWLETHPLGDQAHRWIAATAEGRVVGHVTATPQYYRIHGRRVVAHTPGDFFVLPRYGFQAISLMRRYFRATENYVSCDMVPAVITIESRLGAEVAGQLQYAAKLLDVSRLPMPPAPAPVRRLLNLPEPSVPAARGYENRPGAEAQDLEEDDHAPSPPRPRAPIPKPVKGLLNGGLRLLDGALGGAFGGVLETEELGGFDESFDYLFEKVAAAVPCVPEKDAAFLRWRYGPGSPQTPLIVLGVKDGETLLGYAVLKVTGGRDGYVLDLTTLPGRADVARALLRDSSRYFREAGAEIIRYRFLQSPTASRSGDLARLGFFSRKGRSNSLLVRFEDHGLHKVARDLGNWSYTLGDGEATFWTR